MDTRPKNTAGNHDGRITQTANSVGKLGIIAGGSALPAQVAHAALQQRRAVCVAALKGHAETDWLASVPHRWFRLGAAAAILDWMRAEGVTDICMIGRVRRPSMVEMMPDLATARLLARIGFGALGDDGLLRALTREIEAAGFRVVGAHDVLASLLAQPGLLAGTPPDAVAQADIALGVRVTKAMGLLDVGQAAVVQQGLVLAVEAIEGTDAMLARCGSLRRAGVGGILIKSRKPQQDARLDMPTMGAATVEAAAAAGLRGIAIEAGGALIVDQALVIEAAQRCGLFILVLDAGQTSAE
jgi:UDP-2,3-diacylglucosamine hydrolase